MLVNQHPVVQIPNVVNRMVKRYALVLVVLRALLRLADQSVPPQRNVLRRWPVLIKSV